MLASCAWLKLFAGVQVEAGMPKRVLAVGDGDLSFSLALSRAFGGSIELLATSWLSADELSQRYKSAARIRQELLQSGASLLHQVDACHLDGLEAADIVIFNFPHLGDVAGDCHSPSSEHVQQHRRLLCHFLHAAYAASSTTGEVHLTLCGEQAGLWDLQAAACRAGWEEQRLLDRDLCQPPPRHFAKARPNARE